LGTWDHPPHTQQLDTLGTYIPFGNDRVYANSPFLIHYSIRSDNRPMHSITFSQLRVSKCLDQLEAWLRAGETVELLHYRRVVAHFVPAKPWPFTEEEEALDAEKKRNRQKRRKPTAA